MSMLLSCCCDRAPTSVLFEITRQAAFKPSTNTELACDNRVPWVALGLGDNTFGIALNADGSTTVDTNSPDVFGTYLLPPIECSWKPTMATWTRPPRTVQPGFASYNFAGYLRNFWADTWKSSAGRSVSVSRVRTNFRVRAADANSLSFVFGGNPGGVIPIQDHSIYPPFKGRFFSFAAKWAKAKIGSQETSIVPVSEFETVDLPLSRMLIDGDTVTVTLWFAATFMEIASSALAVPASVNASAIAWGESNTTINLDGSLHQLPHRRSKPLITGATTTGFPGTIDSSAVTVSREGGRIWSDATVPRFDFRFDQEKPQLTLTSVSNGSQSYTYLGAALHADTPYWTAGAAPLVPPGHQGAWDNAAAGTWGTQGGNFSQFGAPVHNTAFPTSVTVEW